MSSQSHKNFAQKFTSGYVNMHGLSYHFCMMDIPNPFNCGNLLGHFSSPCIPLRLGCENIYQTCFSPSR